MSFKDELMEILREELKELKAIRDIAYNKTDIIVKNEIKSLQNITAEEEGLVSKMAALEERRLNLLDSWGVNKSTPLSEIIEKIPEGRKELMDIREELNNLLMDIKQRNDINSQLIQENLEWMEFNINLITQANTPGTYGKKDNKSNRSFFDRKV